MKIYIDIAYKTIYEDKGNYRVFFAKFIDKKDLLNILNSKKCYFYASLNCSYSTIQDRFNSL